MEEDEFEDYDREVELALYREYRDVVSQFKYVIETERRFYLANDVELVRRDTEHDFYFELTMNDVWVWDVYRSDRFVKSVRVLTFKDVNIEELSSKDFELGMIYPMRHEVNLNVVKQRGNYYFDLINFSICRNLA